MFEFAFMKESNRLKDNGYDEVEEAEIYDACLEDVYANPRWYLDNIEFLSEFRVSWEDYRTSTPTLPLRHVNQRISRNVPTYL